MLLPHTRRLIHVGCLYVVYPMLMPVSRLILTRTGNCQHGHTQQDLATHMPSTAFKVRHQDLGAKASSVRSCRGLREAEAVKGRPRRRRSLAGRGTDRWAVAALRRLRTCRCDRPPAAARQASPCDLGRHRSQARGTDPRLEARADVCLASLVH